MGSLARTIEAAVPEIKKICEVSGTPGASIGVMKKGDLVTSFGVGHYDLSDDKYVPNGETIYHVASLTKTMTAAAIGLLVDEGKLEFDTPLKAVLPDFKPQDPALQAANVQDLLSHRTGMSGWNSLWSQGAATPQMPTSALLQTLSVLPSSAPFRDSFCYWNFGYSLLGLIIERLSGQSYGTFVTERIFKPLEMNRSAIPAGDFDTDNYAKAYQPLADGGFVECPRPYARDGVVTGSAGGARSCVSDLLQFFNELMKARSAEIQGTSTPQSSVLKKVLHLTSGHNFLAKSMDREVSMGSGIIRVQLPGSFGAIGHNVEHMPDMPKLGTNSDSQLVLYHQGSYPGFLSLSLMVPEEELVIVVLTNSLAWSDTADWIGQFLLEQALDLGNKHDFVKLAQHVSGERQAQFLEAEKRFGAEKPASESERPLDAFVGDYYHEAGTFFVSVSLEAGELRACFQGFEGDKYPLRFIDQDVFSFFTSRDDQARRGRWPSSRPDAFEFRFHADANNAIVCMKWRMESGAKEPSTLTKKTSNPSLSNGSEHTTPNL